ncbi:amidohydrolase family protein [Terriglobus roseus]|uniref:WD40-like Beta Propeller Repeat n=1 Tax=Terriglobus roseus TaxID=392734 RepID=A0A1H4P9N6_9BACT|nr:amidohydrolase family protein [Terriglobus roseus]SEC03938.1 WD40-like Beta Propeller Repeat [Terriglobus roseus]
MLSVRLAGFHSVLPLSFAIAACTMPVASAQFEKAPGKSVIKSVAVTEGTNMAATVSPDGKTIVFDLQETLWSLPIGGGTAKRLTDPFLEPARPDWSPKGDLIAFQGYKGGQFHIWVMKPDGTGVRQLTNGHGDDREPRVSPDGTKVAFASDRAMKGNYDIWVVDIASGALTQKTSTEKEEYEPTWAPDGQSIAFVSGVGIARGHGASVSGVDIESVNASGAIKQVYSLPKADGGAEAAAPHIESPSFSPDGKLAFTLVGAGKSELVVDGKKVGEAEDVFPFYVSWLPGGKALYTGDGKILVTDLTADKSTSIPFSANFDINRPGYRHRIYDFDSTAPKQVRGILHPQLSPDGKQVLFEALNQLWLMPLGGKPEAITSDTYYKQDASFSPDGKSIVFSTDADGFESLHIMDLSTKRVRRVTHSTGDAAEVSAKWSPDGKSIAFLDQESATFVADVATGDTKEVLKEFFYPSEPSWSPDSKTLTMAVLKPFNMRFREGLSEILTLDLATGKYVLTPAAPDNTILTRGLNGPTFSPDGKQIVFVMDDFLWTMPVDEKGIPSGSAVQLNHENSDSPTWSGDSKTILYLSNTKLHTIAARPGAVPTAVPVDLTYQRKLPTSKVVIYAGTFWNGLGAETTKDVDITVVKNRIVSINPHSANAAKVAGIDKYIDAHDKTVMPGLWESHNHMYGAIQEAGDAGGRLWLAYGFTTLQSQGDEGYLQEEIKESFAADARVGPRYFASAEIFDGERIFYPTNRAIHGDAQIQREFERAQSLEVDNYKTYVRLPHEQQAKFVDLAHNKAGVWIASHYGLPGLTYGMDAMSHVSATSRWGYAYTRSLSGVTYGDVRTLFPAADMAMISTAFASTSLYSLDPTIADDPRLQALDQPWALKALKTTRDRMVKTSPTVNSEALKREDETLIALMKAGGKIMAGIDSFSPGLMIPLEMGIRAEAVNGMKPWQALQTATIIPARAFGYGKDLGSLEVGKIADLDIVDGNPLGNINDMTKIAGVMVNGRYYTQAELQAPFKKN